MAKTNLYERHVQLGGRIVDFAGWELPVQYPTGPIEEHNAVREKVGLFDIDHMGQIEVRGPQAEAFVNWLVTYDISRMQLNDAHYAMFCYADGSVIDDLFVYKLSDPHMPSGVYYFLAINASNRDKDVAWVQAHAKAFDVQVKDISDETYMLAFQGPKAPEIMNRLTHVDLQQVARFTATQDVILEDVLVLLGRTGYTGEDGFELFFPADQALKVWEGILEAGKDDGVLPIGLAARDSLRFEPCMPLYGHELSSHLTPVAARLMFAVSLEKGFIGRDALLKEKLEGSAHKLVGFEMVERGVAREHYAVTRDGVEVGWVTSGMFSPTTQRYLGMAYVTPEMSKLGSEFDIVIRGKGVKAKVVKRPFYTPAYR